MKKARAQRPATESIETIAKLEEKFLENRTLVERIGDVIGGFAGSMSFVALHVMIIAFWFLINTGKVPGIPIFDPYPFILLNMSVSVETVLLSTFVLMKQNRMASRADRRNELTLQIDLLAEKESTKNLQLLQRICEHLGIQDAAQDPDLKALSEETAVEELAEELRQRMPSVD